MWHELLSAVALLLVLEGLGPFLNPGGMRRMLLMVSQMNDSTLRWIGLASMVAGVILLAILK
ncbi:MAG: DUF2065 domain-containing protein [Gammaproteobacteria bacterium]|nr:DUF2065 domain-containing protein [Gammaproteobacteria bacterium]